MPMKILVVPDKFKGTLTAFEAADAIARGWLDGRPQDQVTQIPMSDGGDGFGPVMAGLLGAEERSCSIHDAAGRPVEAHWWWLEKRKLAIVETAQANGLAQLLKGQFHPFQLDTYGVGELIRHVAAQGAREWYLGLGGSATNDGGFGMARALGWRFARADGTEVQRWVDLGEAVKCEKPAAAWDLGAMSIAVDVDNPLLGNKGCSRVYGPQKGLKAEEFELAERCLGQLKTIAAVAVGREESESPGAGAAGGLGYGLATFLGGKFVSGFGLFERCANLREKMAAVDLVITAEGSLDASSRMGKGVGRVAEVCGEMGKRCFGFAGVTDWDGSGEGRRLFVGVRALTPGYVSCEQALSEPARHLRALVGLESRVWVE